MKRDIENKQDIQLLVDSFYEKVKADNVIGFIFNDIVKVDWSHHLPIMYDFWENTLFYTGSYVGNPMEVHKRLNQTVPLTSEHFQQWLQLFLGTVDELFAGEKAELAKQRGRSIATLIQLNLAKQNSNIGRPN